MGIPILVRRRLYIETAASFEFKAWLPTYIYIRLWYVIDHPNKSFHNQDGAYLGIWAWMINYMPHGNMICNHSSMLSSQINYVSKIIHDWLDRSIDRSIDWLIDRFIDWSIDWLIDWSPSTRSTAKHLGKFNQMICQFQISGLAISYSTFKRQDWFDFMPDCRASRILPRCVLFTVG